MRALVRAALAAGILALTWYTLGQIEAMTAAAPLLAGISALLLLVLLRAASIAARRHDRQARR